MGGEGGVRGRRGRGRIHRQPRHTLQSSARKDLRFLIEAHNFLLVLLERDKITERD